MVRINIVPLHSKLKTTNVMTTKKVTGVRKTTGGTVQSVTKYSDAITTISKIDQKLVSLAGIFENKFRTNGDIKMPHMCNVSIHHIKSVGVLIAMLGELQTKQKEYNLAADTLGLQTYPAFAWQGYAIEQWAFDIARRIAQLGQYDVETELRALRNDMQEFVTKEDKFAMLQDKLSKLGL